MNEIKCPHCGQAFTVDEAGYSAILSQVRTKEFDNELNSRIGMIEESARKESELNLNKAIAEKNDEINALNMRIQQLESEAKQTDDRIELAVTKAVSDEKQKYEEKLAVSNDALSKKNEDILRLDAELTRIRIEDKLALKEAVSEIEKQRDTQKAEYEAQLRAQQETLEYYKDMKTKLSTKMIGESLERYCEDSFNMIRSTAFRNAEFGKDNEVREGTKGDYIFREYDDDGNEIISIMFEMKNEMDTTSTKHRNEDFFAKLDKDRKNKKCEYAVLVSMLEADSELYNQGIVDVSYAFDKMYVIRPKLFIPMISLLRNAALNSMEYKRQLAEIKNQEIDITHFEERIENFKAGFSKNFNTAAKQFNTAIEEIDKTIDHLNKVKENLQKSANNLRLANDKAQAQLTIKALAKDNATMTEMFDNLEKDGDITVI